LNKALSTLGPLSGSRIGSSVYYAMVRLMLVVILGCALEPDDRPAGGSNPFRFWLVIAAMVLISFYIN
jgi:hypothetical protein